MALLIEDIFPAPWNTKTVSESMFWSNSLMIESLLEKSSTLLKPELSKLTDIEKSLRKMGLQKLDTQQFMNSKLSYDFIDCVTSKNNSTYTRKFKNN